MAKLSSDEVKHVSKLSKLNLTEKELIKFHKQLSSVVDYISELSKVDTKNIIPTSQTTGLENIFRKEEVKAGLTQEESLSGTDKTHNGYFTVDSVLDKEA